MCSKTRQTDERGALVNCNLLDVVSGDLYIYCMALFIDVKLMMMMMMMKVLNFGVQKIYVKIQKFKKLYETKYL